MSKQEHKYAQVLRWIADGQKVQARCMLVDNLKNWFCVFDGMTKLDHSVLLRGGDTLTGFEFRLAPRTVTVNGVECVAPETEAPLGGVEAFSASPADGDWRMKFLWVGKDWQRELLARGLVFLIEEHAVSYAKAMCNYKGEAK